MIRMSGNRHEHWTPRKRDIEQAKTTCACPPDVLISKLPKDANLITGTGIRDGALVLSPSHLKYIKFPLHPLFHVVLSALDLHPMQLSPNSYLQLSAFLALGLQLGASIDCSDFFHFHDCILIREEVDYFHFASKPNCRTFVNKPTSHKNWKHRPLLVTGNWAAPELNCLKIRSTFAASAANFTTSSSPERIQWLNTYLEGSCLDIKEYSTPAILLRISQERTSFIYHLFRSEHLKPKQDLEGKELATHIVESMANMDAVFSECPEHVAERGRMRERVENRNRSGETNDKAVHSFEDPERVDLDQVEPTMVRGLPDKTYPLPSKSSKLKMKRSGSSTLGVKKRLKTVSDQSAHSSGTCLEPISSPTYPLLTSIPLNKEKNAALVPNPSTDVVPGHSSNCWDPKFKKADGTSVTEEEKLVGNPEACLAVGQGSFDPADASAFQKKAPQKLMKDIDFGQMAMDLQTIVTRMAQIVENKDKQFGELKLKFEQERQRTSELERQLHKVEAERDGLQADIIKVQSELANTEKELKKGKEDRDDRDDEDVYDPGRSVENNQGVLNFLGIKEVDNNLDSSMHPQNSSMTHVETSPNRIPLPPQSNQETSNTTPQQPNHINPLCHPMSVSKSPSEPPGVLDVRCHCCTPIEGEIRLTSVAMTRGSNNTICAGGLFSSAGIWCKGYAINLGSNATMREAHLESLCHGLEIAWDAGYRNIYVESDADVREIAWDAGYTHIYVESDADVRRLDKLRRLLSKLKSLKDLNWTSFYMGHVLTMRYEVAEHLASLGYNESIGLKKFHCPPATCVELLKGDITRMIPSHKFR